MKNILVLFVFILSVAFFNIPAQSLVPKFYEISYELSMMNKEALKNKEMEKMVNSISNENKEDADKTKKIFEKSINMLNELRIHFLLTIGKEQSYFVTLKEKSGNIIQKMVLSEMLKKIGSVYYNVKKDFRITIKKFKGNTYFINTPSKIKWTITNEKKTLLGYKCTKAMGDNQSTEAWFTDDIPISVGPYEYGGLPGAILELNEGNGMIKYVATEIKSLTKEPSILLPKQFINVTKENYDKISNE